MLISLCCCSWKIVVMRWLLLNIIKWNLWVLRYFCLSILWHFSLSILWHLPICWRWLISVHGWWLMLLGHHPIELTGSPSRFHFTSELPVWRAHHNIVTRFNQCALVISRTLIFNTQALSSVRKNCILLMGELRLPLVGILDWRRRLAANMVWPMPELTNHVPLNPIQWLVHQLVRRNSCNHSLNLVTLLLPITIDKTLH